jgi:replicative DNA helicase
MSAALHAFVQEDIIRPLPHALGPEKAVLSVIFQAPEMLDEAPQLTPEHFYLPGHRQFFETLRNRISAGDPVEFVSLIQSMLTNGTLDQVGGASALTDIYGYQFGTDHFAYHVGILSEYLARRMTIEVANKMQAAAYEAAEVSELLEVTSAPISAIHDMMNGVKPARSTRAVMSACLERFERRCKKQETPMGIETSLSEINKRFNGLHGKQTIVISGYPGGGKTTLAGQFAMDSALGGHNTLICSLEMPEEDLMDRMICYVARRPGDAICDPLKYCREHFQVDAPTNDLLGAIRSAVNKIKDAPLQIEDLVGANAYQIASCIRRAHRKNPLKLVVVDYAQRIRPVPEKIRESREQQLSHASNYLADLSKELGFCLLLPSQLNKEGAAKHAEAINEDADLHLQIAQDRSGSTPSFNHVGIAVMKDRHHGQDGELLPIILDGPMLRFIPKPFQS